MREGASSPWNMEVFVYPTLILCISIGLGDNTTAQSWWHQVGMFGLVVTVDSSDHLNGFQERRNVI